MAKFTIRHTFPTDVDTYWQKVFFDDEYNRRLYEEKLGFGYELVEKKDIGGGVITRKVKTEPKADMPGAMKKVVGDSLYYLEEGRFDPAQKKWIYKVTTSKMSDKVRISGEFWAEARGEKSCERICITDLEVKIFGIGGMIEGFVEKSTRESYDRAAEFTKAFIAEKGL